MFLFFWVRVAVIHLFLYIKTQLVILNVLIIFYLIGLNHNVNEFMSLSPVLARHKGEGGAFSPEAN